MTRHVFALLTVAAVVLSPAADAFSVATIARYGNSPHHFPRRQIFAPHIASSPSRGSSSFSSGARFCNHLNPVLYVRSKRSKLAASSTDATNDSTKSIQRKIYLHLWVILTSAFVITNAKVKPYPKILLSALTRQQWALVHAICSMLFSGTIIFSAIMEYLVVASKKSSVIKFWFLSIPQQLDAAIVLPALSGAILSGVGQAYHDYGGLGLSPKHVVGAFHLLLTFGVWWGVTV